MWDSNHIYSIVSEMALKILYKPYFNIGYLGL